MKLAVMQPYLFPYIGYFQLVFVSDKFVIYDDVNFIKRGWINRNRLLISGEPKMFTLPLKEASRNKLILDITISDLFYVWRTKLLRTLELNYKKAPYFREVIDLVKKILYYETLHLSTFLCNSIKELCLFLDLNKILVDSSAVYNNRHLKSHHRIIDICAIENAGTYINSIGGKELYSARDFEEENINLLFLKSNPVEYKQFETDFCPSLSILDVLMFNSKAAVRSFITNFTLEK